MPVRWLLNRMRAGYRLSLEDIPMSKTRTSLAFAALAVGLLAVTAFASTVAAKPGDDGPMAQERREAAKSQMENRSAERQDRHELMRSAHDAWHDCKREANATGNDSMKERCRDEKAFFLNATKARREAHALLGAIAALERRIGRLEAREIALEHQLEDGNLSANETAAIQQRIEKIDSHQDRMAEKLQDLRDRLEARHAKWQSVRDAVADHEDDDEDDDGAEDDDGESESISESESESDSASST
jgi:hypothetical protein